MDSVIEKKKNTPILYKITSFSIKKKKLVNIDTNDLEYWEEVP